MTERDWFDSEADERPSRIGWFAAGALAALALAGALVMTATVMDWPSNAEEAAAETPPVIIEGY